MIRIVDDQSVSIREHRCGFLEGNTMFLGIKFSIGLILLEYVIIYSVYIYIIHIFAISFNR